MRSNQVTQRVSIVLVAPLHVSKAMIQYRNSAELRKVVDLNMETLGMIDIPVSSLRDPKDFIPHVCRSLMVPEWVETSMKRGGVGVGLNADFMKYLPKSIEHLQKSAPHSTLISSVEPATPRAGYPNLDALGSICFGHVESRERNIWRAALREMLEETSFLLPNNCRPKTGDEGSNWKEMKLEGAVRRSSECTFFTVLLPVETKVVGPFKVEKGRATHPSDKSYIHLGDTYNDAFYYAIVFNEKEVPEVPVKPIDEDEMDSLSKTLKTLSVKEKGDVEM
jgi:hypothetical protein